MSIEVDKTAMDDIDKITRLHATGVVTTRFALWQIFMVIVKWERAANG